MRPTQELSSGTKSFISYKVVAAIFMQWRGPYPTGKEARASCLLMRKLEWLVHGGSIEDSSSDRSASLAHSAGSAVPGSLGHSPSSSHSWSRSASPQHQRSASQSSSGQHLLTGDPERVSPGLWLREWQQGRY